LDHPDHDLPASYFLLNFTKTFLGGFLVGPQIERLANASVLESGDVVAIARITPDFVTPIHAASPRPFNHGELLTLDGRGGNFDVGSLLGPDTSFPYLPSANASTSRSRRRTVSPIFRTGNSPRAIIALSFVCPIPNLLDASGAVSFGSPRRLRDCTGEAVRDGGLLVNE
jgi:hypothetical protein